jgi:predicted DNA-binding transcriptional regulator AlpA
MISKPIDKDLISRERAAALLGVSARHLDKLTAMGLVPAPFRFNARCVLFSEREILAHAEQQATDNKVSA